jgi:hypothetical protein
LVPVLWKEQGESKMSDGSTTLQCLFADLDADEVLTGQSQSRKFVSQ